MEFNYSYKGTSALTNSASETSMSFVPDRGRDPTFFRGELSKQIEFREAISALHDVVISDLRWKPKDRTAYLAWRAQQEDFDWAEVAKVTASLQAEMATLRSELKTLQTRFSSRWAPFYAARQKYFDYLYKTNYDAWFVLDPVITVHPDEIAFECFSQDESSYGRLATSYEVYKNVGEHACGTTNIDYSQSLYDEFQKIRSYKTTALDVDPSGFEVQTTHEDAYREVKIDLPDSWVRGFLQVSSAMSLPAAVVKLHPLDVHNLCFVLRRHKELRGPRSLRFELMAGKPVTVHVEPWNFTIPCPRSRYLGDKDIEVRLWGRRRLHTLERLIPIARSFTAHLLGTGMPSFWVADLGDMTFTLGLSGWTTNDWSKAGNFDLMAPRAQVDDMTKARVFAALKQNWRESADSLSQRLDLARDQVLGALAAYTQAGRVIYDLSNGVYRVRELTQDPLPMDKLRFANERESSAIRLLESPYLSVRFEFLDADRVRIDATLTDRRNHETTLVLDTDQRLVEAHCSCNFFQQNRLYQGPCEHILAARIAYNRGHAQGRAKPIPFAQAVATPKPSGDGTDSPKSGETGSSRPRGLFGRVLAAFRDRIHQSDEEGDA